MEEFKNGVISEEALDEIAGGFKLPKLTVKNILLGAGVAITALAGATIGGKIAYAMTPKPKDDTTKSDNNQQTKTKNTITKIKINEENNPLLRNE